MRKQIKVFLEERHCDLFEDLESQEVNQTVGYLSGTVTRMGDLSLSLQSKNIIILSCYEKVNAFKHSCLCGVGE